MKAVKVIKKDSKDAKLKEGENKEPGKKQTVKKPSKEAEECDTDASDSESVEIKSKKEQKGNVKVIRIDQNVQKGNNSDTKGRGGSRKKLKSESDSEKSDDRVCNSKTKIDVYLNDSRRTSTRTEPEAKVQEKKQFKTFEEAFLYSISEGNLGRRNAAKRNHYCSTTPEQKNDGQETTECLNVEVKKEIVETEPVEKKAKLEETKQNNESVAIKVEVKEEANLEEDIEKLKHQTDQFLQKYKKDSNIDISSHVGKVDVHERSKVATNSLSNSSEHNYVCKKKMAAQNLMEQKSSESKMKIEAETECKLPKDLVEKHKDLGQELIQLTHDIIQQQSTKSHKYLDSSSKGLFNTKATSDIKSNCNTSNRQSIYPQQLFGETVSSKLMQSVKNPSNPMYCKEFGKNTASSSLDFSQLANQADHSKTVKQGDHTDMNLLFTIHKLSSALHSQPKSDIVQKSVQQQLQHVSGSQGNYSNLTVEVSLADSGKKLPHEVKSPAILRPSCTSMKSPGRQKSPAHLPKQGNYQQISPIQMGNRTSQVPSMTTQLSPQGKSSSSNIVRIQSPTGTQHQVQLQGQHHSSPPKLSLIESPKQVFSPSLKSPPVLSQAVNISSVSVNSSQTQVHNSLHQAVNVQHTPSVSMYSSGHSSVSSLNQHVEQGQIVNSQGVRMISNGQKLIPLPTATQTQNVAQSVSGQVLNMGQIVNPLIVRQQFSSQGQSVTNNQGMLLRPQVIQQSSGVNQSQVRNVISSPQLVAMANQGLVQLGMPNVTSNPVNTNVQSRIVTHGNQTFLLNIPVMRSTTSDTSGSVVPTPTSNSHVTAISSQGKQNQVGQILLQTQTTVPSNNINTAAPILLVNNSSCVASSKALKNGSTSKSLNEVNNHTMLNVQTTSVLTNTVAVSNTLMTDSSSIIPLNVISQSSLLVSNSDVSARPVCNVNTNAMLHLSDESSKQSTANDKLLLIKKTNGSLIKEEVDAKDLKYSEVSVEVSTNSDDKFSPFLKEAKSDVSLHRKSLSVSPPPRLQSPNKILQLVPQPIVPISQTFTSTMSNMKPLYSDPSLYSGAIPSQLLEGEESEDVKPPILEMEAPMLEMEAPILKLESEGDSVSVKSEPDTLSNYSVGSNSMNLSSSFRSDIDGMPVYPMTGNGLEPSSTIIQTTSYNAFSGQGRQADNRKRRKSGVDGVKENAFSPTDASPNKKVSVIY